jgi:hypothetical protein
MLQLQKMYADTFYSWGARILLWKQVLTALITSVEKHRIEPVLPEPA